MGNKRKASIIVIAVIVLACSVCVVAGEMFRRFNSSSAEISAEYYSGSDSYTITSTDEAQFEKGIYMILFKGADGSGDYNGYGATCIAFYKTEGNKIRNVRIGTTNGGGSGYQYGGGYTSVYSNFARPEGASAEGEVKAGGGGGGGSNIAGYHTAADGCYSAQKQVSISNWGTANGFNLPATTGISGADGNTAGLTGTYTDERYKLDSFDCYWDNSYLASGWTVNSVKQSYSETKPSFTATGSGGGHGYQNGSGGYAYRLKCWNDWGSSYKDYYRQWHVFFYVDYDETYRMDQLYNTKHGTSYGNGSYCGGQYWDKNTSIPCAVNMTTEYDATSYGQGGGGSCSPSVYPVYASDCNWQSNVDAIKGAAYATYYHIDPTSKPEAADGPNGSKIVDEPAIRNANTLNSYGYGVKWVYRTSEDDGKTWSDWSDNSREITRDKVGTTKVECRCVLYANVDTALIGPTHNMKYTSAVQAADDPNYCIAKSTFYLEVWGNASVETAPTENTGLTNKGLFYTGKSQQLLATPGIAIGGTLQYRFDEDTSYTNRAWDKFEGINAKTYVIYYKVIGEPSLNYRDSVEYGPIEITINKADGSMVFTGSTLAEDSSNLKFNGLETSCAKQLFKGGNVTGAGGTLFYGYTNSPTVKPNTDNTGGEENINKLTGMESGDYYLWCRREANSNYNAVGWTYTNVHTTIAKATYDVSVSGKDETYDSYKKTLFSDPNISSVSGASAKWINVEYTLKYEGFDGTTSTETSSDSLPDLAISAINAGTYTLSASWKPNTYSGHINSGSKTLAVAKINKTSSIDKFKVTGLQFTGYNSSSNATSIKITEDGTANPFDADQEVNLVIGNVEEHNGITTNNDENYNRVGYIFTDSNTAPDDGYFECADATELNNAIKGLTVYQIGTQYLWLKIIQHNSIENDQKVLAATVTVEGFDASKVPLGGLIMQGASISKQNGSVVFTGSPYAVVESGAVVSTDDDLPLGDVSYAVSERYNQAPTNWVTDPASLPQKTDYGTYYLWVKWTASATVSATNGIQYASFTIQQKTNFESLYFSGIAFKPIEGSEKVYTLTYNNTNQQIVGGEPKFFHAYDINNSTVDLVNDLGSISYGVGKGKDNNGSPNQPKQYTDLKNYKEITVCDVDDYYLWIHWDGSSNVHANSMVYRIVNNGSYKTPCFRVNQKTDPDNIELLSGTGTVVDTNSNGHPFLYAVNGSSIEGRSQALFMETCQPKLKITNQEYNGVVSYAYLLTESNNENEVAVDNGWVNAVELAQQINVGEYYLWLRATLNNSNVNCVVYFNMTNTPASIVASTDFSLIGNLAPTEVKNLKFTGEDQQLIIGSSQECPQIEYSLTPDDPTSWTTDAKGIVGNAAGVYTIHYRGARYVDENGNVLFETQQDWQDQCFTVAIGISNANIPDEYMPRANDAVYYTGEALKLTDLLSYLGCAKVKGSDLEFPLLYGWEGESGAFYKYNDSRLKRTDAGNYVLYFRPQDESFARDVCYIPVRIKKAGVQICDTNFANSTLKYKAADYQAFTGPVNYALYNSSFLEIADDRYINYNDYIGNVYLSQNQQKYGNLGQIYYAVSKNLKEDGNPQIPQVMDWHTDYKDVKIRQVGTYYLWVKIDAGDNHTAYPAQYLNYSVTIQPAEKTDISLASSSYTVQKKNNENYLHYNGELLYLITDLNLVVKIVNRNENNACVKNGNNEDYNLMFNSNSQSSADHYGTIYYALSESADVSDTDELAWQTSWRSLRKCNAGKYYLFVKFVDSENSNLASFVTCLSTNGMEEIKIEKATYSDLIFTGLDGRSVMYNGGTLSLRELTSGNLIIKIGDRNITNEIDLNLVKYLFWKKDATPINYSLAIGAKVGLVSVDQYDLYVCLSGACLTNNIDATNEINKLTLGHAVTVTPAEEYALDVDLPIFYDLTFNGENQPFMRKQAIVIMKNGNTLRGNSGQASYYISDNANTCNHGDWITDINKDLVIRNVGTYYIWVRFDEGDSHVAITPRCVGSVIVSPATGDDIQLSELNLSKIEAYSGAFQALVIDGTLKQELINSNNYTLQSGIDYSTIDYGYSTDADTMPSVWFANYQSLTAREAGKYYIWVRVKGVTNSSNTKNVVDYCKYYDYAEIVPAGLNKSFIYGINLHELSYNAENQSLADLPNGKISIKLNESIDDINTDTYNPDIEVYWGLGTGSQSNKKPRVWLQNLNEITGMDAGDYYLWLKIENCNNIADYEVCYATVTIEKGTLVCRIDPVARENLIYTGSEQELLASQPVFMLHPTGDCYGEDAFYPVYGATVEYQLGNSVYNNYLSVQAVNAGSYEITYGIAESDNWNAISRQIIVSIAKRDPSDAIYGLSEAPAALSVAYNETEQDLISFGRLVDLGNNRGTALEGSQIVFWYDDEPFNQYFYSYDANLKKYKWMNRALPGKINAGNYVIKYYVTGNDNYNASGVQTINATIAKRQVWWEVNPQSRYDLKYTGKLQVAIVEGILNVGNHAAGVSVRYTDQAPGVPNRSWSSDIPLVKDTANYYIYYHVMVDKNNEFVGTENNDVTGGTMVVISVKRSPLSIRVAPQSDYFVYNAESQNLISYALLSTDEITSFGNEKPYLEYSFTPDEPTSWTKNITAVNRGDYTIYYRLHYNDSFFEFAGDATSSYDASSKSIQIGVLNAKIQPRSFGLDTIRAVYNNGTVSFEADDYEEALQAEIGSHAKYEYRIYDDYNQTVWYEWNANVDLTTLGIYQFRVIVQDDEEDVDKENFSLYIQSESLKPYSQTEVTGNRAVYINLPKDTYSNLPYVRAWLDFNGSMTYNDSPFKYEGWMKKDVSLFCVFRDVNSVGNNREGLLRVQTVNNGYYFRSVDEIAQDDRQNAVDWTNEENYVERYRGLQAEEMTIWLYEVYKIQYDANGATLPDNVAAPTERWKWHGMVCLLEKNVYKKETDNHVSLIQNGWNTARSGDGNNYPNGSYYRENASQVFYANFFMENDVVYKIDWIITDGRTTYCLAQDTGSWFNVDLASNANRETGVFVMQGDLIVLPQIIEDEEHNRLWSGSLFGNYSIRGWYAVGDDWSVGDDIMNGNEYYLNMTATSHYTFVADITSRTGQEIQCVFVDDQDNEICSSGTIAGDARPYMALSGMDIATINNYREGYDRWVEHYGPFDKLPRSATGLNDYTLGAKIIETEIPSEKEEEAKSGNDYVAMMIVLLLGAGSSIASLTIYLLMRKKNFTINLRRFKGKF